MKPMYGVTHSSGGEPIVIEPRTTKVGIGLPRGKAVHVYIDPAGKWAVQVAQEIHRFETMQDAMKFYRSAKAGAPDRNFPSKTRFFLFNRISADGSFEPDWEAIEAYGPVPTEIGIIFTSDDPLVASYQFWTASEKKCDGDGLNAMRILSLAETAQEKALAAEAQKRGERYFEVKNGCWLKGCRFSRSTVDQGKERPSPCRPRGRLLFQLLAAPRLGGTAYFDTTGLRSISQLFSCLQIFRTLSGRGDPAKGFVAGIPLQMVLRPYKTTHNGRPSTQYGVSLEFRAETALELKKQLIAYGQQFHLVGSDITVPQIEAGEPEENRPPEDARAIAAEFSEVPGESTEEQSPDDDEDYGDVSPELAAAWETPEQPEQEAQRSQEQAPAEFSPAPPVTSIPSMRATAASWNRFYQLCRERGMTDTVILQELGNRGYETPAEVPEKAFPDLMRWAEAWRSGQRSLL